MLFGKKIKEIREEQGLLQRQLAAALEIDTPMYSKIERGDRRAKRSQVILLAELLHVDKDELLTIWLADKILDAIADEPDYALLAISVADSQLQSQSMHL
jgi:transcriptional regulator with XRE-family HTH domain